MKIKVTSDFDRLFQKLESLESGVEAHGRIIMQQAAEGMHDRAITNLTEQGRGGQGPALSSATHKIYEHLGKPTGSGIRDHLLKFQALNRRRFTYGVGISDAKAVTVARVQDRGAIIRVSPAMRNLLGSAGVHLNEKTSDIVIPARYFWRNATRDTKRDTLTKLSHFFDFVRNR